MNIKIKRLYFSFIIFCFIKSDMQLIVISNKQQEEQKPEQERREPTILDKTIEYLEKQYQEKLKNFTKEEKIVLNKFEKIFSDRVELLIRMNLKKYRDKVFLPDKIDLKDSHLKCLEQLLAMMIWINQNPNSDIENVEDIKKELQKIEQKIHEEVKKLFPENEYNANNSYSTQQYNKYRYNKYRYGYNAYTNYRYHTTNSNNQNTKGDFKYEYKDPTYSTKTSNNKSFDSFIFADEADETWIFIKDISALLIVTLVIWGIYYLLYSDY